MIKLVRYSQDVPVELGDPISYLVFDQEGKEFRVSVPAQTIKDLVIQLTVPQRPSMVVDEEDPPVTDDDFDPYVTETRKAPSAPHQTMPMSNSMLGVEEDEDEGVAQL